MIRSNCLHILIGACDAYLYRGGGAVESKSLSERSWAVTSGHRATAFKADTRAAGGSSIANAAKFMKSKNRASQTIEFSVTETPKAP